MRQGGSPVSHGAMLGLHTFVNERSLASNPGTGNKIAADKQVGNRAHKLGRYLGGHTATQGIGVPLANNLYCSCLSGDNWTRERALSCIIKAIGSWSGDCRRSVRKRC